jgi:flagellar motility protein MotE (MotC chaperone)
MRNTPRLLPILIVAAAFLLSTKVVDVFLAIDLTALPRASAETKNPTQAEEHAAAAPAESAPPKPAQTASNEPTHFSQEEVGVLQSLSKRRAELDQRAGELDQRDALLQATEQRINEKIAKLQEMQKSISTSFKKEDDADDAKLKSLVKVYETMKPKDAARIFEQLDLPVVLDVVERMKDRNTAAILAAMDPAKAKTVTVGLVARRPVPELKAPDSKAPDPKAPDSKAPDSKPESKG